MASYAAMSLVAWRERRARYGAEGRLDDFARDAQAALDTYQAVLDGDDGYGLSLSQAEGLRLATKAILTGDGAIELAAVQIPQAGVAQPRGPDLTLSELLAKWAAQTKHVPRTRRDLERTIRRFEAAMPKALTVRQVTKAHIIAFKDTLLAEGKTPANINIIIPFLGTLFNFAVANDLIEVNPAKGVRLADKRKAEDKRRQFTRAELKQLFSGPVHQKAARPEGGGGEAAYWLPLLALFTGARQTELGQLYPDDVHQEAYEDADGLELSAWVIRIVENEARGQKVKNEGSERRVPVHQVLIDLGFLDFVRGARQQERIFSDLKANAEGELMGNWSKWFGRYRRTLGISSAQTPFHSFRHSFKYHARQCGLENVISNEITGHDTSDVADDYAGLSYPLGPLVEGMARYRVPGFDPPPPPHR